MSVTKSSKASVFAELALDILADPVGLPVGQLNGFGRGAILGAILR
jgi:hypothetical protein